MQSKSILYIFPHPDDESFGPAAVMHRQIVAGHSVYLLTLTRGGATKQRLKYNKTVDEMGVIRNKEMENMAKVLCLSDLEVLDLPDNGLKHMDPLVLEAVIAKYFDYYKPDIVVTYPVHGISGFHDHLVTHAVVKRVFCQYRQEEASYPARLAFTTLKIGPELENFYFPLNGSKDEEIDCIINVEDESILAQQEALHCYKTYLDVIEQTEISRFIKNPYYFELYNEKFDPVLDDLTINLPPVN